MAGEKLQDRRFWIVGGAALMALMAAASWLVLIQPKMSHADDLRSQTADTQLQNAQLAASTGKLASKYTHLSESRSTLLTLLRAVPPTNAFPTFTRDVNALAQKSHVVVNSISVGAPVAVAAPAAPAPTAPASDSTSSATSANAASQAATTSVPDEYEITVTIAVGGAVADDIGFVRSLQHGERDLLVSSMQVATTVKSSQLSVQADIFTAPMTPDQLTQLDRLLAGH